MALKIHWTDFAKKELQNIFDFHKEKAGLRIAKKLTSGIAKRTRLLKERPSMGQREEMLLDRDSDFRYIVYKNYKIFYHVRESEGVVWINDVFDTRQNPLKIRGN